MTKRLDVAGMWADETVAILGAGPDMTEELALTAKGHKTIAVNRAVKFAPWADMFVALDPHHPFWEEADKLGFKGMRILGVEHPDYDALYPGMMYETVQIAEGHTIQIRNNALAALRIAFLAGAKRIILLGFDCERYEEIHAHTGFYGLTQGLEQMTAEIRAAGVEVERIDSKVKKPGTRPARRGEEISGDGSGVALPPLPENAYREGAGLIDPATFPQQKPKKK